MKNEFLRKADNTQSRTKPSSIQVQLLSSSVVIRKTLTAGAYLASCVLFCSVLFCVIP